MASVSARADLEQFIVECLQKLDPTLDTTTGSRVYTLVVDPLLRRLGTDPLSVDVTAFIESRMRDTYPQIDITTPGSFVRDILASALTVLLEPLRSEALHVRQQLSLADYDTLSEAEMDALLANVLASRVQGSFSYGVLRIFFSSARTVGVDASTTATTTSGISFVADTVRIYLPSEMRRQGNLWYIDVDVRSAVPTGDANIAAGTPFIVNGIDGVVRATNPSAIQGGLSKETNTDFYDRALNAMSEQSLNTERGISRFITENTPGVVYSAVVGFGDPLMQRDVLTAAGPITISNMPGGVPFPDITGVPLSVNANEVHLGGATDIYVKSAEAVAAKMTSVEVTADSYDNADLYQVDLTSGSTTVACTGIGALALFVSVNGSPYPKVPSTPATLELVGMDTTDVTPLGLRIIAATSADALLVETAPTGFVGSLTGVHARLATEVSVDLKVPKRLLQVGTLTGTATSPVAVLSANVSFANDPATEGVYLEILSGISRGEYRVLSKLLDRLVLDRIVGAVSNVPYRVYTKQSASASYPLLQVTDVTIDNGAAGERVPYSLPVGVTLSEPQSARVAPLTVDDIGTLAYTGAQFIADPAVSFVDLGVHVGDLVYVNSETTNGYYFVVTAVGPTYEYKLTVDRTIAGAPGTTVDFAIGPASFAQATVSFLDPTYLEVTNALTDFVYEDATGDRLLFAPAGNAEGLIYNPTQLSTTFSLTSSEGTFHTSQFTTTENTLALGVRVGDIVDVQSIVLQSTVFTDVTELAISVYGSTLSATIDGVSKQVFFSQTNPNSLASVVAAINQQLGPDVYAVRHNAGVNSKYLRIYSRKHVVLSDVTAGTLAALHMGAATNNRPSGTNGSYEVKAIASNGSVLGVVPDMPGAALGTLLMLRVKRPGAQVVFPAGMEKQPSGLYTATIQVESRRPLAQGAVPANAACSIADGTAVYAGYRYTVDNAEYSFSMGEKAWLTFSTVFLPASATTWADAITLVKSVLTIAYEYSAEVSALQTAMLSKSLRVTCNNPLVRHFLPAYPVFGIQYQGLEEADTVRSKLLERIIRLYPSQTLEVYDILAALGRLRVDDVAGPVEVGYLMLDKNRVFRLIKSLSSVSLTKDYHVMGELDYVTVTKG